MVSTSCSRWVSSSGVARATDEKPGSSRVKIGSITCKPERIARKPDPRADGAISDGMTPATPARSNLATVPSGGGLPVQITQTAAADGVNRLSV